MTQTPTPAKPAPLTPERIQALAAKIHQRHLAAEYRQQFTLQNGAGRNRRRHRASREEVELRLSVHNRILDELLRHTIARAGPRTANELLAVAKWLDADIKRVFRDLFETEPLLPETAHQDPADLEPAPMPDEYSARFSGRSPGHRSHPAPTPTQLEARRQAEVALARRNRQTNAAHGETNAAQRETKAAHSETNTAQGETKAAHGRDEHAAELPGPQQDPPATGATLPPPPAGEALRRRLAVLPPWDRALDSAIFRHVAALIRPCPARQDSRAHLAADRALLFKLSYLAAAGLLPAQWLTTATAFSPDTWPNRIAILRDRFSAWAEQNGVDAAEILARITPPYLTDSRPADRAPARRRTHGSTKHTKSTKE